METHEVREHVHPKVLHPETDFRRCRLLADQIVELVRASDIPIVGHGDVPVEPSDLDRLDIRGQIDSRAANKVVNGLAVCFVVKEE